MPGGDIVLPGDPAAVIRVADNPGACNRSSAARSSPPTARRCWAPTTRRAWPSSWKRPPSCRSIPRSRTARSASASPATRRSATASITSIWRSSAPTVCYTLDGGGAGEIDVETFSADLAVVTVRGVNIHPVDRQGPDGQRRARGGRFRRPPAARRALRPRRPASAKVSCIPTSIEGGVAEVTMRILLRDFDTRAARRAGRRCCATRPRETEREYPGRDDRSGDHAAVSQHGRRAGARAARRGVRRASAASGWAASRS